MITKLQEMCGRQFTSKWVGMTKDMLMCQGKWFISYVIMVYMICYMVLLTWDMLMCQDTKTALSDYINLKKGSAKIELLGPLHGMEWNILALTRG